MELDGAVAVEARAAASLPEFFEDGLEVSNECLLRGLACTFLRGAIGCEEAMHEC